MNKPPVFRTAYNYDTDEVSNATAIHFPEPTLCVQDQAKDTDINEIVRRFGLTGELPSGVRAPTYGDFIFDGDYRDALEAIRNADESFMAMPADVRARFENDPAQFIDFVSDEANRAEAEKLGLVLPKAEIKTEVVKTEVTDQSST